MKRWCTFVLLGALCALPMSVAARARSVWDGVYSEDQAKRGETVYRQNCALCHGLTLGGTENAPELVGDAFLKNWYGKPVNDLFKQVREKMPKDAPGILSPQQVVDAMAVLFRANKFPAGSAELAPATDVLTDIRIEKQAK